jgi:choline dehydrogenase-like flavoprotein
MATSHTIGLAAPADRLRTFVRARTRQLGVQVFGTMIPQPTIGVSIERTPEPDCTDQRPIVSLSYDGDALANMEAGRARFRDVLGAAGLGVRIPGPFHDLQPGSSVHFGGTVRMHDDPRFGVLDRWNRIHDADDVVVCDMSAFTTGPEKNPTLTAMALAIRAADHLADEQGARVDCHP